MLPPPSSPCRPPAPRLPPSPPTADPSCPLTFHLAGQGLADHTCVILLVCRPLVHKEGRVGGPGVKHDPKLRVTARSGGRGPASIRPAPPPPARGLAPTLVSAGKRTLVASTRMRMSVVRPEATAAPCRAARTRFFQVSPMRGRHLPGQQGAPRLHGCRLGHLERRPVLAGTLNSLLGQGAGPQTTR